MSCIDKLLSEIINKYKDSFVSHEEPVKKEVVETPKEKLPADSEVPSRPEMESSFLFKYFDEDPLETTEKIKSRIMDIYEMINGDKSFDGLNIQKILMNIEGRIGSPDYGKSRVDHVYQYLRLGEEMDLLQKQRMKYETQDSDN